MLRQTKPSGNLPTPEAKHPWQALLDIRVVANHAVRVEAREAKGLRLAVPVQPKPWARPPLTWLFPMRTELQVALDDIGKSIWEFCEKEKSVSSLIEYFAKWHRLSFHESRAALTPYLQKLTERGILILVAERRQDG